MSDCRTEYESAPQQPQISVVVASVSGLPSITDCLEALVRQKGNVSYEVLVVDRCGEETRAALQNRFPQPQIRLIAVDGRPSISRLRAIGINRARGRWIAILEDHCNVVPEWCQVVSRACAAGHHVIGGAIENGSNRRTVDWAVFFCEYSRFMLPLKRGPVIEITGNNSVYDRTVLSQLQPELDKDALDSLLHRRLRELGIPFYCEPDQVAFHKKEFGCGGFVLQRYHYSRSYASMRLDGAPKWKRMLYAGAMPLLPGLLLARIIRTVVQKGRHRKNFLRALPLIGTFVLVWAWGEAVGALFGPGTSLEQVE